LELAGRAGRDAFPDAHGQAEHHPAQPAREHHADEAEEPAATAADLADEQVVDAIAQPHAHGTTGCSQNDAVRGQPAEADERAIADRLDADDQVADQPADKRAAEKELRRDALMGSARIAKDAEEHPAE